MKSGFQRLYVVVRESYPSVYVADSLTLTPDLLSARLYDYATAVEVAHGLPGFRVRLASRALFDVASHLTGRYVGDLLDALR